MQSNKSLSVIMPALNEERHLEDAVNSARKVIPPYFQDWEILIFNDGSEDRTGEIADRLASQDSRIRVTHHETPKNLGGVYKAGIGQATKEYVILIPGDNENGDGTLTRIFNLAGSADIVIPYVTNPHVRPLFRRMVSRSFVFLINALTGCRLRYYNGTVLHKTKVIRSVEICTDSFGYQAEALAKLVRRGHAYREVGVELVPREQSSAGSHALKPANVTRVLKFLGALALDVRRENLAANPGAQSLG